MTRFVFNDSLWAEIRSRVSTASHVKAAVAYLGDGGADLLPLKKGDTLVVNMGLESVKQGATSPKEIQRLVRKGVHVFTRSNLHAKFFICDQTLIVGSANVSKNSQNVLDEAASLTSEKSALRRAHDFFDRLCTEPVRPEYLKLCLNAYNTPIFPVSGKRTSTDGQKRIVEAKLWFIGGIRYRDLPAAEVESASAIEENAAKRLSRAKGTHITYIFYSRKPRYFDQIRPGDWIITCMVDKEDNRFVHSPGQIIGQESYARGNGKKRYLLLSEAPDSGEEMTLKEFRVRIRHLVPELDTDFPRTKAIENIESADAVLSQWTPSGCVAKKRKGRS